LLKQTSETPAKTPNKSLPMKIVSVNKIYFRQLAAMHEIFAVRMVRHTPNFVAIIPPINDPIAIPSVP